MKRMLIISGTMLLITALTVAGSNLVPTGWAGHSSEAQAASGSQTAILAVEKMTCAVCPITVRNAIERVEGVESVIVDFEAKTATVVFNPAVTTSEKIGAASTNAGYPATPES